MVQLPKEFLARMQKQLGADFPAYLKAMEQAPKSSLRVNTLKIAPEKLLSLLGQELLPVPGTNDGFVVPAGFRAGNDPFHAAGLYYMQEASAQMPARLPAIESGWSVLDLCASPGGKSTQLAARLSGTGILVANEFSSQRVSSLISNIERMGITNAIVMNMDTEQLCTKLAGQFDVVLCDAPCAGEGMFRKNPQAVAEWSPEHVSSCAVRERAILNNAARAVKPGGQLIYSTCSFSPLEDEETVSMFLESHTDFLLVHEEKLYPHSCEGEGQYMASFIRSGERFLSKPLPRKNMPCASWEVFRKECSEVSGSILRLPDGRVFSLPPLPFELNGLRVMRAGLLLGEDKGNRFVPSHALAMASPVTPLLHTEPLSEQEAIRYLFGETIPRVCEKGWCAVTYRGYALGLAKSDGTILKNHYPSGLRRLS